MDQPRPHGETIRTLEELPPAEMVNESSDQDGLPAPEATADDDG